MSDGRRREPSIQRLLRAAIRHGQALLNGRWLPAQLAVLACVPLLGAISSGFQLDDHFHRLRLLGQGAPALQLFVFYDGDPVRNLQSMNAGLLPWWTAESLRHASFRYLSVLTMQLDYRFWPHHPALMHMHSLLWLSVLVTSVALFYRRVMTSSSAAGLAALLYALDDAHALPTTYLANRNALISTCLGVLCLLCYTRSRRERWRAGTVLGPAALALALAAGEMALATAGYLLAYALCLETGTLRRRFLPLLPNAAVLLAWVVTYVLGGFGSSGSGFYLDPLASPAAYAFAFLERAPLLLMGQWTPIPSDLGFAVRAGTPGAVALNLCARATVLLLSAMLVPLVRRDPLARFFATGAVLALVPIAAVAPQDRLLFFVGLGSMGLLARLACDLASHGPSLPSSRFWRLPAQAVTGALLTVHLLLAPFLALTWIDLQAAASARMQRALSSVPHDPSVTEQDLILVNPPEHVYLVTAIPVWQRLHDLPAPRRLRALTEGSSPLTILRLDARTLQVELEDGLFPDPFSRYFRSRELSFAVDQRVDLDAFSVEIVALDTDGDPNVVRYRFAVALEDPSLRWLYWKDGAYASWQPPEIGEARTLPASHGIFD